MYRGAIAPLRFRKVTQSHFTRLYQRGAHERPQPAFAFAFDIDGVLVRGPQPLPAAKRALAMLEGANPKIPYILLTNGGGSSEEARCRKLTSQLGVDITPSLFIQAHTILKSVVQDYADFPILVLGGRGGEIREVAEGYGFKKVYTTLDVLAWNPAVWPFHELTHAERQSTKTVDFAETPISAIFVFHDPRNWALDIQIICDLVQSGGMIGVPKDVRTLTTRKQRPVELVFCNPDIIWRSDFERPRLGQGAFREAFQAVHKALTGSEYAYVQYGKPTQATYRFAEKVLHDRCEEVQGRRIEQLSQIYMVGDNPESDIAGANAARWKSILVHTGVYDPRQGPPTHLPTHEAKDVEEAVRWAIARQKADAL